MAGTRKYKKNTPPKTVDAAAAQEKYGWVDLSAEEFEILLRRNNKATKEDLENTSELGKNVKRYVRELCELSNGTLSIEDFKKNGKYCFPPQTHSVLFALFSEVFEGGTKDYASNPSSRIEQNEKLIELLGKIMVDDEFRKIMNAPTYYSAKLESLLNERILSEISDLLNHMYNTDSLVRSYYMLTIYESLLRIRRTFNEWDARMKILKEKIYDLEDDEKNFRKQALFNRTDSLVDLLILYLRKTLDGEEFSYLNEDSEVSLVEAYISNLCFGGGQVSNKAAVYNAVKNLNLKIQTEEQYLHVMHAIKKLEPKLEPDIYDRLNFSIELIMKALIAKKYEDFDAINSKEKYNTLRRMMENSDLDREKEILKILQNTEQRDILEQEIADFLKSARIK
jgi:hypothetical protein